MSIPHSAIAEALALLPAKMSSQAARVMLYAVGLQESGFRTRLQYGNGPARGFWQFEQGGGIVGVLTHPATASLAGTVCRSRAVIPAVPDVHAVLAIDDTLAAAFARLLLWTDRAPLPAVGDAAAGWVCYLRSWRPGRPQEGRWAANYAEALRLSTNPPPLEV